MNNKQISIKTIPYQLLKSVDFVTSLQVNDYHLQNCYNVKVSSLVLFEAIALAVIVQQQHN